MVLCREPGPREEIQLSSFLSKEAKLISLPWDWKWVGAGSDPRFSFRCHWCNRWLKNICWSFYFSFLFLKQWVVLNLSCSPPYNHAISLSSFITVWPHLPLRSLQESTGANLASLCLPVLPHLGLACPSAYGSVCLKKIQFLSSFFVFLSFFPLSVTLLDPWAVYKWSPEFIVLIC